MFWACVSDAVPCASRMGNSPYICACGHPQPDRAHVFWSCPVLDDFKTEFMKRLPDGALTRVSIWLARSPDKKIRSLLWRVYCLAFFTAADVGRKAIFKLQHLPTVPSDDVILRKARFSVKISFWGTLLDFVHLSLFPPAFVKSLETTHPFICRSPTGSLRCDFQPP
jgi:hypothetical protein